jgi:hypothetical protein
VRLKNRPGLEAASLTGFKGEEAGVPALRAVTMGLHQDFAFQI